MSRKQLCGGCLQTKDTCPEQCPARDESKKIYVNCWTSKGLGVRWNDEDGWKRLRCKAHCGLWAYSKPTKWELSGSVDNHGIECFNKMGGRKRKAVSANDESPAEEEVANERTPAGNEQESEDIVEKSTEETYESTSTQEVLTLKDEVNQLKSQLEEIKEILLKGKQDKEEIVKQPRKKRRKINWGKRI